MGGVLKTIALRRFELLNLTVFSDVSSNWKNGLGTENVFSLVKRFDNVYDGFRKEIHVVLKHSKGVRANYLMSKDYKAARAAVDKSIEAINAAFLEYLHNFTALTEMSKNGLPVCSDVKKMFVDKSIYVCPSAGEFSVAKPQQNSATSAGSVSKTAASASNPKKDRQDTEVNPPSSASPSASDLDQEGTPLLIKLWAILMIMMPFCAYYLRQL